MNEEEFCLERIQSIRRGAEQEIKQWADRLANIRRWEVPPYLIEIKQVQAQRDLHLAQTTTISRMHDEAMAKVKELEAKLALTQHDRAEQQRVAMESENESIALRARVAELEQHNKDLAIAVQKYGDDKIQWERAAKIWMHNHELADSERKAYHKERDKALADLVAERSLREQAWCCIKVIGRRLGWVENENDAAWQARIEDMAGRLVKDIADERERSRKERLTAANYQIHLEQGRDAARAEVAALKERKVTLPARMHNPGMLRAEGYDAALESCADAIRAAGVEVES